MIQKGVSISTNTEAIIVPFLLTRLSDLYFIDIGVNSCHTVGPSKPLRRDAYLGAGTPDISARCKICVQYVDRRVANAYICIYVYIRFGRVVHLTDTISINRPECCAVLCVRRCAMPMADGRWRGNIPIGVRVGCDRPITG